MSDISQTLEERGKRYGQFRGHANITQQLKWAMMNYRLPDDGGIPWQQLSSDKKEALEMIAHKIGRILNGDPNFHDSWHDIVGYAKLVADTLEQKIMIPASPILCDVFDVRWEGTDAVAMDDLDISRVILRDKANSNQPEIKGWRRVILEWVRGRV